MKRNLFKKLAATVGAAVMALTLVMPLGVQAATPTIDTNAEVTLTIEKHVGTNTGRSESVTGKQETASGDTIPGVEFTAVKIADIVQVSDASGNNSVKYKLTADAATLDAASFTADAEKTGKELNDWLNGKKASDFDKKFSDDVFTSYTTAAQATTDDDGLAIFTTDEQRTGDNVAQLSDGQGLYLVVETYAPSKVTERSVPFLVSLPMTDKENKNDWMYNVYAYPKNNTGEPDVKKEIDTVDGAKTNVANGNLSASAQIGDEIVYHVPMTAIVPDAGLTELKIVDTMSKGLTFVQENTALADSDVTVYTGDAVNESKKLNPTTDYKATLTNGEGGAHKLTVSFTETYLATINTGTDKSPKFLFVYKAQLNKDAILGTTGNANDVDMIYDYSNNLTPVTVPGNETKVFTWGIDLTKTGDDGQNLVGVEFTLKQDDAELQFVYDDTISAYRYVTSDTESASATLTTRTDGKLVIRGLDSGTYVLTETKTNSGYTLLKSPITIEIIGSKTDGSATAKVDGKDVSMNNDTTGSLTALVPLTVVNNTGFDLPATGAAGTAAFAIAGIVIVAVAGALLVFRRKSNK